jgi:hypothetical protein
VEGKNGSIILKHLSYVHIPQQWAPAINQFYQQHFTAYINYQMNINSGSSLESVHENNLFLAQETTSQSYGFFSSHSFSHFTSSALPNLDSTSTSTDSLLTPATAGAMIIGVVGLSLLLYKNAVMVRATVNAGCRLLQRCFYGRDDSSKTFTNLYSFHSKTKIRKAPCKDQQPPRPLYAPS